MDEYNILFKYGVEVGILGAFLWAFKRILSYVLNDKATMMEVVSKNTEAFYEVKGAIKESCNSQKSFQEEAVRAIKGFQQSHRSHSDRDEKMIKMLGNIAESLNGEKK